MDKKIYLYIKKANLTGLAWQETYAAARRLSFPPPARISRSAGIRAFTVAGQRLNFTALSQQTL